jgi:hypothetical protein
VPDIVTTVRLPTTTHYLVGVAAASRQLSAHAWMVRAIEDTLAREVKSNPVVAAALKTKSTPAQAKQST